jgi:HPt (histidine-containing phosphotransfer) domain-containing protein
MDAYVSKPIRGKEVFDAIGRLTPFASRVEPGKSEDETSDGRNAAASDQKRALARLGGDLILFRRLARLFLNSAPSLMSEIREAISQADSRTVERASHKLKGSAGYFCAESVQQAALRLETLGRNKDLSNAATSLAELEDAMQALSSQLELLSKEGMA